MFYIFGAGVSGIAAARYLLSIKNESDNVCLIDSQKTYSDVAEELGRSDFTLLKDIDPDSISKKDIFIPSPGISPESEIYKKFTAKKCNVIGEVELSLGDFGGKIIAITGTNGKSTTTEICTYLCKNIKHSAVSSGNIGLPPSQVIVNGNNEEYMALELSSYQLEIINTKFADAAIFTNFTPDHLERHKTLEAYFEAKWKLVTTGLKDGAPFICTDSVVSMAKKLGKALPANTINISEQKQNDIVFSLISNGDHNKQNARLAIEAVSLICSATQEELKEAVKLFPGLEHRCEIVKETPQITIVNDSKSTNVESTLTALKSFKGPITLILGGEAKKESFAPIANFNNISQVLIYGKDKEKIYEELGDTVPRVVAPTLEDVLNIYLAKYQDKTKTLLFSPGCASFDQFSNFEMRGQQFKHLVKKLIP